MQKVFLILGACSAFVSVAAGAFGAHFLREKVSQEYLAVFETGARYEMYHALALIGVALALTQWPSSRLILAGWFFAGGTVLFSGSLYLLALTQIRILGAITPLGGVMFLAGWAWMIWAFAG